MYIILRKTENIFQRDFFVSFKDVPFSIHCQAQFSDFLNSNNFSLDKETLQQVKNKCF